MAAKKKNTSPSYSSFPTFDEAVALCNRAVTLENQGNVTKAHRILNDARHHLDSSPIFHRYRSPILYNYAIHLLNASKPESINHLIQESLTSARRATQLSPSDINFSAYYVRLLVALSENGEFFEEAAKECKRALEVEDPVSFDLECLRMEKEEDYQEELQFLSDVLNNPIPSVQCKKMLARNPDVSKVRKYLKSITLVDWKCHLRVDVKHFEDCSAFTEALNFAKDNHKWKFWVCPRCEQKFGVSESQMQHVLIEHMGTLSEELKPFLPEEVNQDSVDDAVLGSPGTEVGMRAFLDPSSSYIDLDLDLKPDYNRADTSSPDDDEIMHVRDISMLFWLYEKIDLAEHLASWTLQRKARRVEADNILQNLEKEFEEMCTMCTEKRDLLAYQGCLQYLTCGCKNEPTMMNVISDVFKEAEAFKEARNVDDGTSSLDISSIEAAFQKLEESSIEKLRIIDAKIMTNLFTTRKLKTSLALTSAFDYLTVLAPLLKSYVQMNIEKTVAQIANRESEAEREATLAELLHDADKNVDKREDGQKQKQETSRGKTKSGNSKKFKGRKV